jgi:hypothetical protein
MNQRRNLSNVKILSATFREISHEKPTPGTPRTRLSPKSAFNIDRRSKWNATFREIGCRTIIISQHQSSQIIINNPEISRTHDFPPGIPRDFTRKNPPPASPAPNLLARFESEITEGGKILLYFERFSARPAYTTMHNILLVHGIRSCHNRLIRINLSNHLFHNKSK